MELAKIGVDHFLKKKNHTHKLICYKKGQSKEKTNNLNTKFHLYSELGYIIITTSFIANYDGMKTNFSLNMIIRKECLDRYLLLYKVIEDRMRRSASMMQKLINQKHSVGDFYTKYLPNFESNLDALYHASLPSSLSFSATFFSNVNYDSEFLTR